MTTLEEQLDELISLATDAGRIGAEYQAAERARDLAMDKRRAGRAARSARAAWEIAERKVSMARRRFLALRAKEAP